MPTITIVFELVDKGGPAPFISVIGYSLNQPLPSKFWYISGYVVGQIYSIGETVKTSTAVTAGRNYIVFGTSADYSSGFWTDIKASVKGALATTASTTQRVHRRQYGYLAFDVSPDGKVTKVSDGTVEPDESPPVTSVGGGGGGQTTKQTMTIDIGPIINQMMQSMMPPMMQMMGMMMMVQMMQGMTEVFATWS